MALETIKTDGTETGSSASIKINDGFTQIDTNLTSIDNINAKIVTSSDKIDINTTSIATNTSNISTLQANDTLQDTNIANLMKVDDYRYITVTNSSTTSDVYSSLNSLSITNVLSAEVWNITLSMIFSLDTTTTSAFFRFSFDNGVSWTEVREEVKDITDSIPVTYTVPYSVPTDNDNITVLTEYKVETAGSTLSVPIMNIITDRKI